MDVDWRRGTAIIRRINSEKQLQMDRAAMISRSVLCNLFTEETVVNPSRLAIPTASESFIFSDRSF